VVERFNQSLKYEHLYREEIPDAVLLTQEVERFREIYNGIRPHEALRFLTPMAVHLADSSLFQGEGVQELDSGQSRTCSRWRSRCPGKIGVPLTQHL